MTVVFDDNPTEDLVEGLACCDNVIYMCTLNLDRREVLVCARERLTMFWDVACLTKHLATAGGWSWPG